MKFLDLTGRQFGTWTVLARVTLRPRRTHWLCRCVCGAERAVDGVHLRNGASANCGCQRTYRRRIGPPPVRKRVYPKRIPIEPPRTVTHGACRGGYASWPHSYRVWRSMRNRTVNPSALKRPDAQHYVAKGVRLCDRWMSYENFVADMGEPPSRAHTIDRIRSSGHYEPGNCRWATRPEQVAHLPQNQKGYRRKAARQGDHHESA